MALEDVTKKGPIGLKGLKGVDKINEMSNEEYDAFISSFTSPSRDAIRLAGALSMGEDFEVSTGQNVGESKYDKPIISQDELENISEYRASEQAWYDQLANGLGKAVVLAGTTFIDSTLGTIVGATSAVAEQKFSNLWDNPISRAMLEVNEWSERVLPNYYSEEEQRNNDNGEWYKNVFTSNFWGDKFLKNMGFTMGAMGSAVLTGGALKGAINAGVKYALGKQASDAAIKGASAFVRANVGAAVASIGESKIEALHSANDWYDLQKAKLDDKYGPVFESLEQYRQEPELYNSLAQSVNEEYELELAKLNDLKAKVGNVTFGLNMPITYGTNLIAWGKLLSGGYNTAASSMNISKRLGKYVSDTTPVGVVTGSLAEGTQEISQKAAATIPGLKYEDELESFYNSNTDSNATDEAMSWMKAFAKGISDTVSDPNSWEEFTLGALTKIFGTPMIRRNDGKLSIGIEDSIVDDYREYKKQKDLENSMVDALNSRIESEDFKNYYDGITRHIKYQNDMNEAAENKDAFAYKNAEDSQLISDIIMFDKAGRLNDLVEMINDATELSDENIQSIIENTTDADGNGPFSQNGNSLPKEEVINKINERKDNILKQIESYRRIKEAINISIGDRIEDSQLEELTWLKAKSNRNTERINELSKEITPTIKAIAAVIEQENPEESNVVEGMRSLANADALTMSIILKQQPEVVQVLKEAAYKLDSIYHLDYTDNINKIDDVINLFDSLQEFETKFKEYSENPIKQAQDKAKAKEKSANINEASENIKKKDNIVNKSVSEINESIDNGDFTEDDLLGMFPDGLPDSSEIEEASEAESKAKAALDIRDKTSRIKSEIDKSDLDDTTKNNAKKLIDNSKSISDSLDDLTDLSSEAFNDPSLMFDNLDPSLQGLDTESLQDELEIRLGGAKDLLSEVISIVNDNEGKLNEMPKNISEGVKESSVESTGHDSVDKNEPINKSKAVKIIKGTLADSLIQQAIDESNDSPIVKTLRDVIKDIDKLVNAGAIEKTIKKTVYSSASYKKAVEGFPGLVQSIDNYISNKLQERDSKAPEIKEEKGSDYNPSMEDDIPTVNILISDVHKHADNTYKSLDKVEDTGGIYTSWLSPLSKYYRYSPKGDMTTFDQVAEGMNYTPEKLKRVKAIWNYLNNHDVFEYISSGNVKVGDTIGFAISQTLNDEAGELVVIMLQDNHIVGVLPSENDKEFNKYAGLSDFMDLLKKEYNEAGSPASFISKYHTSVNKIMVGRVPYTSEDNNLLNQVFSEETSDGKTKRVPIELGISSGDGRNVEMIISSVRKGTSRSVKDKQRTIMSPLNAKKGQPYLLIRTSDPNRAYFPVPFRMTPYSKDNEGFGLGEYIEKVLKSLKDLKAKDIMKAKRELQELLAIPELHINILKNGNLKIDAKFKGEDKQVTLYNGRQDNPDLVQTIKEKLYGTPFQVSRKYINDTYEGQDYNELIARHSYTNLPIGGYHTIDDWFTINPIDKDGNEFKGKAIKSTRNNPNSAKPQVFEYNWKGIPLKVDLNTFEVRDSEGNLKEGKNADIVKALAYGFKNSKSGTYKTPFGWFNSETLEFVDEPKSENVIKRTFNLEESSELILREATGENVRIVDSNTRPFSDSIVNSFINAFNNSSIEVPIDFINSQAENDRKYSIAEFLYRVAKKYGLTKSEQERVSTIMKQYPSADFGKRFPIYDDYLDKSSKTTSSRPEASNTFATPEELEEQARKKGLISSPKRKSMWKALDMSQQEAILNIKGLKQEQTMKGLELAYDVKTNKFNMSKLKGSIENYLGMKPLYRRVTESKEQVRERELKWLSRVLPNLSSEEIIKIVDGLIEIPAESGGGFAWGQFKQGIIEISNVAARGTVYHEAFHAITHTLLNYSEYEELFKAGRERYGNLSDEAIEENLAEDFRRYMQLEEMPFVGRVVRIFRTLKHIVQNLLGKETYLNKVYYNINHAKFANREVQETDVVRNLELTPKRFQEIVDSVVNNATHTVKGRNNEWGKFVDSWKKDGVEVKGYRGSNNRYIVTSVKNVSEQSYYRRIEQHHREKYMLGNLSNEDKQYLIDRGISIEEYNRMSQFEREVLFHCK